MRACRYVLDVLEQGSGPFAGGGSVGADLDDDDDDTVGDLLVKVEQDCGTVLIDAVTAPRSIGVRSLHSLHS